MKKTLIPNTDEYLDAYLYTKLAIQGNLSAIIYGETGVGKNNLVRSVHQQQIPKKPMVTVDCGAICPTLIESELFGYEKGAFTGADMLKKGKIEEANQGILFLDEISNASLDVQMKLLRVLQEKKVCRLGSTQELNINFTLIAATNKNLKVEIEKQTFKEDLYYRLKQVEIVLPPLRDNVTILQKFTEHFVHYYNQHYQTNYKPSKKQLNEIRNYSWPGNIRELELDIQKRVCANYLDINIPLTCQSHAFQEKEHAEKIINLLEKNHFNIAATARELDIPRSTLNNKLKKMKKDIRHFPDLGTKKMA